MKPLKTLTHFNNLNAFGHYLAGLWEGDGHIGLKNKLYPKPSLHITMSKMQKPFLEKILKYLTDACHGSSVGSV